MKGRKWYEWFLTIVYIAMLGLCVYLNFTPGHKESIATIVVNIIMFIIVAIIFLTSDIGSFVPMNSMIKDLKNASEKIRKDAMNTHSYLWEPYQNSNVKLFANGKLQELFQDFIFELNRDTEAEDAYYRPSIDDYINLELVDKVMHRNELNQVPGMLTGLGILGTFIGLSLGLQNFNTGTTAQMTESIEPLMNGIKVAFHTSIYGMVFSLTYNTVYKKKLYEAECAVEEFTSVFKKFVLPDTANDGMNELISLQKEQLGAMDNMYEDIASELNKIITPQFDKLTRSVNDFEMMASKSQQEALGRIVESFVNEMNQSLGNTFWQINQSVNEQYKVQQQNAELMGKVLEATGSSAGNLNDINRETERLIITLNKYTESIETIQKELQNTIVALRNQTDRSNTLLFEEQNLLKNQGDVVEGFKTAVERMAKDSADTNERVTDALEEVTNGVDYIRRQVDKQSKAGIGSATRR